MKTYLSVFDKIKNMCLRKPSTLAWGGQIPPTSGTPIGIIYRLGKVKKIPFSKNMIRF